MKLFAHTREFVFEVTSIEPGTKSLKRKGNKSHHHIVHYYSAEVYSYGAKILGSSIRSFELYNPEDNTSVSISNESDSVLKTFTGMFL